MTNPKGCSYTTCSNPLTGEYVNAVIQRHGYDSPESVIERPYQWMGRRGGEDFVTLLMYEAHEAVSKLRAPVVDERAAFEAWFSRNNSPDTTKRVLERKPPGKYQRMTAQNWWEVWQGRAALASARVAGEAVGKVALFGGELKEVSWTRGRMPPPGPTLFAAPQPAMHNTPAPAASAPCAGRAPTIERIPKTPHKRCRSDLYAS